MKSKYFAGLALCALTLPALAVDVTVTTGDTIEAAFTTINAGGDAVNTITLTPGVHIQANPTNWTLVAGKTVNMVAQSGRPIVRLTNTGTSVPGIRILLPDTAVLNVTGIDFIPQNGSAYANNVNDAIVVSENGTTTAAVQGGDVNFTDCIFSYNDGSDGVGALVTFNNAATDKVGDDWFHLRAVDAVFSNCLLTGCWDDAILVGNGGTTTNSSLTLNQGSAIAEIGGAGIQVYNANAPVVLDGTAGRVQIANAGYRTGVPDTGVKFFWDAGVSFTMTNADIMGATNAAIYDFEGIPTVNITNSRIARSNSGDATPASLIHVDDASNDSAYASTWVLDHATLHDDLGATAQNGIFITDGASEPTPTWTITNSIFSGAGDQYDLLNAGATAVNVSNSAVVTAGTHAVAAAGDLAAATLNSDPAYVSETYTTGRSQENPDFLRPTTGAYLTASSTSGVIGGAPAASSVSDWTLFSN